MLTLIVAVRGNWRILWFVWLTQWLKGGCSIESSRGDFRNLGIWYSSDIPEQLN